MHKILVITLFLTVLNCYKSEDMVDTCRREESCGKPIQEEEKIIKTVLGLPGTDAEWADVLENMKMFATQIKTSFRELGLGQFVAELAEMSGLPGTKNDWMSMFKGVTLETIVDGWNEFMWKIGDGIFYFLFFFNYFLFLFFS
jgi:hypothetical protein